MHACQRLQQFAYVLGFWGCYALVGWVALSIKPIGPCSASVNLLVGFPILIIIPSTCHAVLSHVTILVSRSVSEVGTLHKLVVMRVVHVRASTGAL